MTREALPSLFQFLRRWRTPKRWTDDDVNRALAIIERWHDSHPNELAWFAHTPAEEAEGQERYGRHGIAVIPVYPARRGK